MTTIPNQENLKHLEFSSVIKDEEIETVTGPFLAWWVYLIVVVTIFCVCLVAHLVLKKVNDNRFEERFVRLYGKTSASTQVSTPTLHPDVPRKLERKFPKSEKLFKNPRGISLIFSKEQNKGRTSLTTNWPADERWKKVSKKSIKLHSSSSLARKPSNTIQVYVSDNMSKNQSQNGSTSDLGANNTFHNLNLDNAAETNKSNQADQIKLLETKGSENNNTNSIVTITCVGKNENTDITKDKSEPYEKLIGVYYGGATSDNSVKHTDKARININPNHDIYSIIPLIDDGGKNDIIVTCQEKGKATKILRNEMQCAAPNESSENSICDDKNQVLNEDIINKPIALIIAKKVIEKELEIEKNPEKNINFKPPVTIIIPENSQTNETKSDNDVSIKMSIDSKYTHEHQDTSESKTLHDLSRSKESIKKSVSRVTFKHETMTPNVDDVRSSETSRSRTEFLKSSVSHSKESIMKSSVTHSKESIKKQPSRVTFVNGIKLPSSDSDSDVEALVDAHFDITKITDSMTRLSEKTYSRESKLSDKIEENILKKYSKVNFSEAVVTLGKVYPKRSSDIKSRTNTAMIRWEPENVDSSKSLLDQMVFYKNNIEQKVSNLMLQEASTSKKSNFEEITEHAAIIPNKFMDTREHLDIFDTNDTGNNSVATVCPNASRGLLELIDVKDPVSVHFAQENADNNKDPNRNECKDAHNTHK